MAERTALRIGAFGGIVGGILGVIGNLAHPRETGAVEDVEAFLAEISGSAIWVIDHLVLAFAVFLFLAFYHGLTTSITGESAQGWARFGWSTAIVGVSLGLVLISIDTMAMSALAELWETASDPGMAVVAATSATMINLALFTGLMLFLFGLPPLVYGVAMLKSSDYAAWLGWVAVIFGGLSLLTGLIQAFTGVIALTAFVLFPIASIVITLWAIYLGVLMNRQASALAARPS